MSYIGVSPQLKAYKDAMFVAVGGETVIPIKCDMETLVVKNGSFLIPRYDFYINRENTINVATAASKGDKYYIINISTFTFSESITRKEVEDMLDTNARPLFEVTWWPSRTSIPAGLVPADGQELSRALFMDAFTGIEAGLIPLVADADWLSTPSKRASYTTGNGSTTFRVPDYNGKSQGSTSLFLRGDGNNSGRIGEVQGDGIKTHYSSWFWATKRSNETPYLNVPTTPGGINPVAVQIYNMDVDVDNYSGKDASEYNGGLSKSATIISTIYSGEDETRPTNTAGVWCVRLFNGTVYSGRANAAQLATEVSKLYSDLGAMNIQINRKNYTATAASFYDPNDQISTIGTKIRLPVRVTDGNMVTFTVRVYQSYNHFDVQFSGYMYAITDNWHEPKATLNSGTTSLDVKMGRDDDGVAYVWIGGGSYTGVAVTDVVSGYVFHTDWSKGWSIVKTDTTPNISLSKKLYPSNYDVREDITLINEWTNYSQGYESAGVTRVGNLVKLKGLVTNATTSNTIITALAPEHRPRSRKIFLCCCNGGYCRIDVMSDGVVKIGTTGGTGDSAVFNSWLSLEQISYTVE